jgi:flavin-binding protein dodecin
MAQKVIDIVGASKESFAKAAENAVAEAAKTVRGLRWARVADFEMQLNGKKITEYQLRPASILTSSESKAPFPRNLVAICGCGKVYSLSYRACRG